MTQIQTLTSETVFTNAIFSTSLLPTIEYFSSLLKYNAVTFEQHENFRRQSNRSRYHILSPNGIQTLQIPIVHKELQHCIITDVKISYRIPWQKMHWRSIQTAYNRSPFFEFYKDDLESVFFKEEKLLFDYNQNLLKWILKSLKQTVQISFTDDFEKAPANVDDLRNLSNSKNTEIIFHEKFNPIKYSQVFGYKFDFIPNLSVIDLIFNCGKNASDICKAGYPFLS